MTDIPREVCLGPSEGQETVPHGRWLNVSQACAYKQWHVWPCFLCATRVIVQYLDVCLKHIEVVKILTAPFFFFVGVLARRRGSRKSTTTRSFSQSSLLAKQGKSRHFWSLNWQGMSEAFSQLKVFLIGALTRNPWHGVEPTRVSWPNLPCQLGALAFLILFSDFSNS